jgi:predicted alpha/beta hydrolase family esterase
MTKHILFLQGAGEGAHAEDQLLVESLESALGSDYDIRYPTIPDDGDTSYAEWKPHLEQALAATEPPTLLVGHSVGASVLLKYLSEVELKQPIEGIFLMATPFWGGDGWRYDGYEDLELPKGFADKLPKDTPIFLYHCRDDETAPFDHLALYEQVLPQATLRPLDQCGHQFNNDLSTVAKDIKALP